MTKYNMKTRESLFTANLMIGVILLLSAVAAWSKDNYLWGMGLTALSFLSFFILDKWYNNTSNILASIKYDIAKLFSDWQFEFNTIENREVVKQNLDTLLTNFKSQGKIHEFRVDVSPSDSLSVDSGMMTANTYVKVNKDSETVCLTTTIVRTGKIDNHNFEIKTQI